MISTAFDLAAGLLILGVQAFALFLMALGAFALYEHVQENKN